MSQFSFPVLETDELMHCLNDMEIPVDAGSLAKPTYEAFRPVFEQLVVELTGVTRWIQRLYQFPSILHTPKGGPLMHSMCCQKGVGETCTVSAQRR